MRKDQVCALLEHAKKDLDKIEFEYNKALKDKNTPYSLRIDIKNFMENLRSVLDYLAHDIYDIKIKPVREAAGKPPIKKVFFPYGKKTKNDFESRIGACLPELDKINPALYSILESIQFHSSNDSWLCDFCDITNEKKHSSLVHQERTETQTMTASTDRASVTIPINNPNVSIQQGEGADVRIGGVPVRLSNQGIEPLAPGLQRTITTWVSYKFENTDITVLPFLKKIYSNISQISNKIYTKI